MPLRPVIDPSASEQEIQIAESLLEHIQLVREITIARAGKRAPIIRRLEIELTDADDARTLAKEAAQAVVEIAESDADGNRRRYHVALLGAAPTNKRAPTLATVAIAVSGDGDDDGDQNGNGGKVAARLANDIGDRNLRLLDSACSLVERVAPLASAAESASAERVRAQGETSIALLKLEIAAKERKENITLLLELAPLLAPIAAGISQAIIAAINAKAASYGAKAE